MPEAVVPNGNLGALFMTLSTAPDWPMRKTFCCILAFAAHSIVAQNLVPNPGFEIVDECPYARSQIHFASPWETASNGTPDLYHSCSMVLGFRPPNAGHYFDSYQPAHSGNGFAELIVYYNSNVHHGNEYMQTPLLAPLSCGTQYFIEFYVSPDSPKELWRFTDAIGLSFTDTFYYEVVEPHEAMSLRPAIEHFGEVISDTVGWTRISGCYTARGGERYAIVGNFRNEEETIVEVADTNIYNYTGLFYIDDVLVMEFNPLPDTILVCNGVPEQLNAAFLDAIYLWNTGEVDSAIWVSESGTYTVEAMMDNCILTDSVRVISVEQSLPAWSDTTICEDESLTLEAPVPGTYQWLDGTSEPHLNIHDGGMYELRVTNDCGQFVFTTEVHVEDCSCDLYAPNIFSPNNDGVNDAFEIFFNCDHVVSRFAIVDRWGGVVHRESDIASVSWDGTLHGTPLQSGVYLWRLEYQVLRNGLYESEVAAGDITLVR